MWRPGPVAVLLILVVTTSARADGIVLPGSVNTRVQIPDQQALIHYQDGIETLVVETRFSGQGSEFAWVVPVPSIPEVIPVTTGVFPTLRSALRPQLGDGAPWRALSLALTVAVLLVFALRAGSPWPVRLLIGVLFSGCLLSISLPSLGKPGGGAPAVAVLDRAIVGSYDTAVISGPDGSALTSWLTTNGYATPPEARPIIDDYAKAGWVFVASRLRLDSTGQTTATPHPLAFKFKTAEPVYPLRLTGLASQRLSVDLYVFGDERAAASGFKVITCCTPRYSQPQQGLPRIWVAPSQVEFSHSQIRNLVGSARHATLLRATLSPSQMQKDLKIRWDGHDDAWTTKWDEESAFFIAAASGLAFLLLGLIATDIVGLRRRTPVAQRSPRARWWALASVGVSATAWLLVPTAPVEGFLSRRRSADNLAGAIGSLESEVKSSKDNSRMTADWARSKMLEAMEQPGTWIARSPIDEDSPGNFTVMRVGGSLQIRTFDEAGREFVTEIEVEHLQEP
jgi:hypothetical protein